MLNFDNFSAERGGVVLFESMTLAVAQGEIVALVGPSGSGKSTLLDISVGISVDYSGSVSLGGAQWASLSYDRRAVRRRELCGIVGQTPDLLDELDVVGNVALPLRLLGMSTGEAEGHARARLADVGLGDRCAQDVATMSGGERQRVAIARALVRPSTSIVVADEPTSALDLKTGAMVIELLLQGLRLGGTSALLATHDPAVAERCDRIVDLTAVALAGSAR